MNESKLDFNGLLISKEHRHFVEKKFRRILGLAPSDAVMTLCFTQGDNELNGDFQIHSRQRLFKANHNGQCFITLMETMSATIMEQLKDWKKHRFCQET